MVEWSANRQGKGQGVDRGKIAAGVPVYGYDFAAKEPDDLTGDVPPGYKVLRYKEILDEFPDALDAEDANIKVDGSTPRPDNEIGLRLADEVKSDKECKKRVHEMWEAGQLAIRPDYEGDPT